MIKSTYIHIPFCNSICTYCDFPKMFKSTNYERKYLDALKCEINTNYHGEVLETIYVGGGTPSCLDYDNLKYLLEILKVFKTNNLEYTIEVNVENISEDKLKLLSNYGINRISVGIETFNNKYLSFLGRRYKEEDIIPKINLIKKYFSNINVDLMYAFPNQTLQELKEDLKKIKKLDVNHISTYSLIIEPNTVLYNQNTKNIDEDLDYLMYQEIVKELSNYHHYEISNFSKPNFESKHNLTYWNNLEYYGFGLGASGYMRNIRYTNTRSINNYINAKYILESHKLTKKEKQENEFILGLRKIEGIDIKKYFEKYHEDVLEYKNINKLIKENKLIIQGNHLFINPKYIYISNEILVNLI